MADVQIDNEKPIKQRLWDCFVLFLAELLGTALYVYIGCISSVGVFNITTIATCLAWGFAVLLPVQWFGCISGGFVNPAVTLAAAIYQKLSIVNALLYFVAQLLGAFLGYGFIIGSLPKNLWNYDFCVPKVQVGLEIWQALLIEYFVTLGLVWIACACWDPRNKENTDSISIRFGLGYAGLCLASINFTGASLNPARAFATAVIHMYFKNHWVYWVSPILASVTGSLLYKYVFSRDAEK
ncbi:uncharacterized protein Dwil_GK23175 [Drosophila willistoni]|uniref:Aquaporin n=1 Tax=Drosophila willistoni TaxID=7260 RepID=B4NMM5_DROWI|nr:aquaporin-4 [Drosophila willistoni]EDW85614.1 uncharacterized protein Dwil_GK23175 [Drosophila willistoni]